MKDIPLLMRGEPELFTVARNETRLEKFKREHGVQTHRSAVPPPWIALSIPECKEVFSEYGDVGDTIGEIMSGFCRLIDEGNMLGVGHTEEAACLDLARRMGIPLTL